MDFDKFIDDNTKDKSHYLLKAKTESLAYYQSFMNNISFLEDKLNSKQFVELLKNKLQLSSLKFYEKQFIQSACETTVNAYFAKKYPTSFAYEKKLKLTNKKNVECQVRSYYFTYNIEVKCADFEAKEKIETQDSFKFSTYGRINDYKEAMQEIGEMMIEGQKIKGDVPKPLLEQRKMDNNLKDFLISANEKFDSNPNESEVNILVVCCGDANDIQHWHNYMYAPTGLFTRNSFYNPKEYTRVDIVVLTNIYHRHYNYFEKLHLEDNWNFGSAFNLAFSNPFRSMNKEESIKHFLKVFPHYTYELEKFKLPPSNEPEFIRQVLKSIVGIPAFVKYNLTDKGKILF